MRTTVVLAVVAAVLGANSALLVAGAIARAQHAYGHPAGLRAPSRSTWCDAMRAATAPNQPFHSVEELVTGAATGGGRTAPATPFPLSDDVPDEIDAPASAIESVLDAARSGRRIDVPGDAVAAARRIDDYRRRRC